MVSYGRLLKEQDGIEKCLFSKSLMKTLKALQMILNFKHLL